MNKLPIINTQATQQAPAAAASMYAGNVSLVTLGCAKNLVDSEVMLGALVNRGFRPIDKPENADLIIVNTCGFLQSAVEEGIDTILRMSEYKKNGRCRKLVVAGCMVERYREQLVKELPEVDRFISIDEILTISDDSETTKLCIDQARRPYFLYDETMPRVLSTGSHSAFVKVSEGCNRPCAFCIIPKLRGELRSRSVASVITEMENLLLQDVREFNLVAQDLTAYGTDFEGNRGIKSALGDLFKQIDSLALTHKLPFWVRPFYAYPVGTTEDLLQQIIESPVICNYFDIPLQHISHDVLKRMRRPLGAKGTRQLVEQIRNKFPQIALRTTFIVGFPGETDEDVEELQKFVAEGHFTHVGVFTYSQEEEADSFTMSDQIDEKDKEQRKGLVMETQQEVVRNRLNQYLGQKVRVLIDGLHPETDLLLTSRSEWQGPETDGEIIINEIPQGCGAEELTGHFAEVEITEQLDYDLIGKIVSLEN